MTSVGQDPFRKFAEAFVDDFDLKPVLWSNDRHLHAYHGRPKHKILGPTASAINCLPPTMYVIGEALLIPLVGKCHKALPSRSSRTTTSPLVSPYQRMAAAVANT